MERSIERYTGVLALMATWETSEIEPDNAYMKALRAKAGRLRTQLKMKGWLD